MSDPYVYPGTNVLINKYGIRDQDRLEIAERLLVFERLIEPTPNIALTYEGYQALHHHLFQDVYDWAGKPRNVDMAKADSLFCRAPYIDSEMEKRFALLKEQKFLKGLRAQRFARYAAEHISEINAIHPFREGNGRTQQLFLDVLADQAGHRFNRALIKHDPWNEASKASFRGDYAPMVQVIETGMRERRRDRDRER